jgi:hypothetical protein
MKKAILLIVMGGFFGGWVVAEDSLQVQPVTLAAEVPAPKAEKGTPLPVHTIEGYGGGAITPTAYLVNAGPKDELFGRPSIAGTYLWIGHGKNLETASITETLFGRLELGYGFNRFGIGDLRGAIQQNTGVDVGQNEVYLHNFNARFLAIEENSFNQEWLPAVTAGVQYKYNDGINSIDNKLGGALTNNFGLSDNQGVDVTLTASKTFGNVFGRPLIVSAGLRNSSAAWIGYLGFGDERSTTFEGNVIYVPFDWLALGYEYRQKSNPFNTEVAGLVGGEDDLHAVSAIFIPNKNLTIALVYGYLGTVANSDGNHAYAVQVKWEF